MQEKESIMVVRCELKILSLGITVQHHSASLVMPNSYPHDRIFNLQLTTIKDSYILTHGTRISLSLAVWDFSVSASSLSHPRIKLVSQTVSHCYIYIYIEPQELLLQCLCWSCNCIYKIFLERKKGVQILRTFTVFFMRQELQEFE